MRNSRRSRAAVRIHRLLLAPPCFRVLLAAALAGASLLPSCSPGPSKPATQGNQAPVIHSINLTDRVHIRQKVAVAASVTDAENDYLGYIWTVTRGNFPAGNKLGSVIWQSPTTNGTDTLRVVVNDAEHTVTATKAVPIVGLAPPEEPDFVLGASVADIRWRKSIDEGIDLWRGYEVYRATHSLPDQPADSLLRYRITPTPIAGTQEYRAADLVRGVRYYFRLASVRSWDGGTQRSPFSPQLDLSPRPTARDNLRETDKAENAGFALDLSGLVVRALIPTDTTGMANYDLYLGTSDAEDGPGALMLKSVSKLRYAHPGWAGRAVRIKPAGTDYNINTTTDDGWQDQALVEEKRVYVVRLPEGNYAKLQIPASGIYPLPYPHGMIFIQWAYQLIPDYPCF